LEFYELLKEIHHRVEANERSRITQNAMAKRLGISVRTYIEYLRGTNAPIGMQAMILLLSQLKDEEIVAIVRQWSKEHLTNTANEFKLEKGNKQLS